MSIAVIIQARTGDGHKRRLPRKEFSELHGKTMIEQIVRRCEYATIPAVVAVSVPEQDVEPFYEYTGICCHGGPEEDLLTRLLKTASELKVTHFVRVTGDCPLVDPNLIDAFCMNVEEAPVITNWPFRSWPDGMDLELYNVAYLRDLSAKAKSKRIRGNFPAWIAKHRKKEYKNLISPNHAASVRLTVDYPEDLDLVRHIYNAQEDEVWDTDDILDYLAQNMELLEINKHRSLY